jgi:hypothetical protein
VSARYQAVVQARLVERKDDPGIECREAALFGRSLSDISALGAHPVDMALQFLGPPLVAVGARLLLFHEQGNDLVLQIDEEGSFLGVDHVP